MSELLFSSIKVALKRNTEDNPQFQHHAIKMLILRYD